MQTRFLLGPAGSGKTSRCLAEISARLRAAPTGPRLILLAPKQATFQLERQLLDDPGLPGYCRLQILSFDRLAEFVLSSLHLSPPQLLAEEGRVMVLRALMGRMRDQLKAFRTRLGFPGFTQQLSRALRDLQQQQQSAAQLRSVAVQLGETHPLKNSLHDLALLLEAYTEWLRAQGLQDADSLLDLATSALRAPNPLGMLPVPLGGIWVDGFAELTSQELDLLREVVSLTAEANLAFCLDKLPGEDPGWLSVWSTVTQTFRKCYQRLAALPGRDVNVEVLPRSSSRDRFAKSPLLLHLESFWARPQAFSSAVATEPIQAEARSGSCTEEPVLPTATANQDHYSTAHRFKNSLRIVQCPQPEAEAIFAAHEIISFVREGGRYRDCAVLVRVFDGYHNALQRLFERYEIPFFLDRRAAVAHHPLAELTRCALRIAAFGWQHQDWFGALKTGLAGAPEAEIDRLENEALARGWKGSTWQQPLRIAEDLGLESRLENLRQRLLPPFVQFAAKLAGHRPTPREQGLSLSADSLVPTGAQLADAFREFWSQLEVENTLEEWGRRSPLQPSSVASPPSAGDVHLTVLAEMISWVDNLELAFAQDALPLNEWQPIVEAGLSNLSVGVIPPALDQVLIGTVERSRNPDLRLALVLGMNETVFPAQPVVEGLLTESERDLLFTRGVELGPDKRRQISREQYFGYIACTRARDALICTHSVCDAEGQPLNPSPFLARLKRLFPALNIELFSPSLPWQESRHPSDLLVPLLKQTASGVAASGPWKELAGLTCFRAPLERWQELLSRPGSDQLSVETIQEIYGKDIATSVSGLEEFAACPFKFFISRGLRAGERKQFQADNREQGSFQHVVLMQFHHHLESANRRWRDLTPEEAQGLMHQIGTDAARIFGGGLFQADERSRFVARFLVARLEALVAMLVRWMAQYQFDPTEVEVDFGLPQGILPAWKVELGKGHSLLLRGKIDRIDLFHEPDQTLAVVIDYKSSEQRLDPIMLHYGLELQLLSYLRVLEELAEHQPLFGVRRLLPIGGFYVGLRRAPKLRKSRAEVVGNTGAEGNKLYQHAGRFDASALDSLDNRHCRKGDQFNYARNKDGSLSRRVPDAMESSEFRALLAGVENHIRKFGQQIFAGTVAAAPYRKGNETACGLCQYQAICRFDPWADPFRILEMPSSKASEGV